MNRPPASYVTIDDNIERCYSVMGGDSLSQISKRAVIISVIVFVTIIAVVLFSWVQRNNRLRAEMESCIAAMIDHIEDERFQSALSDALEAKSLAERLRDDGFVGNIDAHILLIEALLNANDLFDAGKYLNAKDAFFLAYDHSFNVDGLAGYYIGFMTATTEDYIRILGLLERADGLLEQSDYEAALLLYEESESAASALGFTEGLERAAAGLEDTKERIVRAKRSLAEAGESLGDINYFNGRYEISIAHYQYALEIFSELSDTDGVFSLNAKIELAERGLALQKEMEAEAARQEELQGNTQEDENQGGQFGQQEKVQDVAHDDILPPDSETISNYDHNISLYFDMISMIDDQRQRPANQIRMGSIDGRNEGWYNGCGWVAAYNALLILGDPHHPAEIVKRFESSGGTVMEGIFGTYPRAIEDFFIDSGYSVGHVLFPQSSIDIDEAIRASRVSILAYLHTSAAHYVAIEYREADGTFVVYNDGFARARSVHLGLENDLGVGAVIDSPAALIRHTRNILFSFSLITIS